MMRKKGPALYELIRDRHRAESYTAPAPRTSPVHPEPVEVDDTGRVAPWFSPGRTVRVPMGYFFFGIGLLLIVAWAGYAIGYHRAEAIGERLLQQQASEQFPRDPMFSDLDLNPDLLDQGRDADQKQNSSGSERGSTVPGGAQNREQQPGLFVIEAPGKAGDPRQKGMNYYQLMTSTNLPEVVRAADFLSRNNVPVAVCRENGNNSDPDFVLQVLKPFPGNPERSAEGRQFKETLMRLGREYKRDHGGVDFNSLVPYKFQ